jgi:hypothetical protein
MIKKGVALKFPNLAKLEPKVGYQEVSFRSFRMLRTSEVKRRASKSGSRSNRLSSFGALSQVGIGMPFSTGINIKD